MPRKLLVYGKSSEELEKMPIEQFIKLIPSRRRRSLRRGFTELQKKLIAKIKKAKLGKYKKAIKTHARDMVIIPEMLGLTIQIYNGREFFPVHIVPEMLGHLLGEFSTTRKPVTHSAPGLGATKSSSAMAVK